MSSLTSSLTTAPTVSGLNPSARFSHPREYIPSMKRSRDLLTLESPTVYLIRCLETKSLSSSDEKTIIGSNKDSELAQHYQGQSLSSNTGVDNGYMYGALREVGQCRFEDERAHRNVMTFNSMRHINNPKIRIGAKNNSFHFGDIGISQSEIREQSYRDH